MSKLPLHSNRLYHQLQLQGQTVNWKSHTRNLHRRTIADKHYLRFLRIQKSNSSYV